MNKVELSCDILSIRRILIFSFLRQLEPPITKTVIPIPSSTAWCHSQRRAGSAPVLSLTHLPHLPVCFRKSLGI